MTLWYNEHLSLNGTILLSLGTCGHKNEVTDQCGNIEVEPESMSEHSKSIRDETRDVEFKFPGNRKQCLYIYLDIESSEHKIFLANYSLKICLQYHH